MQLILWHRLPQILPKEEQQSIFGVIPVNVAGKSL